MIESSQTQNDSIGLTSETTLPLVGHAVRLIFNHSECHLHQRKIAIIPIEAGEGFEREPHWKSRRLEIPLCYGLSRR
jgi:hypothetical protein